MLVSRELKRRLKSFEPCLPRPAKEPPAGPGWVHEIKHDGFRIIARRDATGVRLITRNGYDFADRFPLAAAAIAALPARILSSRFLRSRYGTHALAMAAEGNRTARRCRKYIEGRGWVLHSPNN
jgi:hypothetical protein